MQNDEVKKIPSKVSCVRVEYVSSLLTNLE